MSKTKRQQQAIYLDEGKARLLDQLAEDTGIPKQHYFREAVDLLLVHYGRMKRPPKNAREAVEGMLARHRLVKPKRGL